MLGRYKRGIRYTAVSETAITLFMRHKRLKWLGDMYGALLVCLVLHS